MKAWAPFIVLLIGVVASAVSLIALKHQGRQLFIELEREGRRHDQHQVEWSRLQIELAWLGETGRIETQALDRLQMKSPDRVRVLVAEDG
ncbi:MAG: cell division protein FtsL [Xanthomonadales bacterium]|nr:cell division protein FtsL [Xanthomonadales bacterium]|tara:strand:+ start:168 stop:437 length:270 start_codon:yes stop_codon:yes gene_type:complete